MRKLTIACGLMLAAASGFATQSSPGVRYIALAPARAADEPKADAKAATPEELAAAAYASLEKNCGACHGEGKRLSRKAPVSPASYQVLLDKKLVVPGKPEESPLYTVMLDKDNPMPPAKVTERPTAEEMEAIRVWIEKGAPAPKVEEKAAG
jgi:mono/diheme cytochrome c family protein